MKCAGECHKKYERLQCGGCLRWVHLDCSQLPHNAFWKYISSNTGCMYHCSVKCELKMLPFNKLDDFDFVKYVNQGKLQYVSKKSNKREKMPTTKDLDHESMPSSMCEYLDPCDVKNVVNDQSLTDLTVYHSNVCSLRKNLDELFETFQNGTKLLVMGRLSPKYRISRYIAIIAICDYRDI